MLIDVTCVMAICPQYLILGPKPRMELTTVERERTTTSSKTAWGVFLL